MIISIVILSLKWLKSSLSSLENTYENKFWIVFSGCLILLINTIVLFKINWIISLSEKKVWVDMFNPSGFFKQVSGYRLSVI